MDQANSKFPLTHKDELSDSFIFSIIHDLKNMMVPILSRADMLQFPNLTDEKRSYIIKQLSLSCTTMMDALNKMVRICKDYNNIGEIVPTQLNLRFLVIEVLDVLEEAIANKHIEVSIEIGEDFRVYADHSYILSVLSNLIGNALKFTPEFGHIRIREELCESEVRIIVEDDGVGIDEAKISALINSNQYFTTPGTNGEVGTGFGLLLCVSQLRRCGSSLEYGNNPEKGAFFSFKLPLA